MSDFPYFNPDNINNYSLKALAEKVLAQKANETKASNVIDFSKYGKKPCK